jgi:hypothetical protein
MKHIEEMSLQELCEDITHSKYFITDDEMGDGYRSRIEDCKELVSIKIHNILNELEECEELKESEWHSVEGILIALVNRIGAY